MLPRVKRLIDKAAPYRCAFLMAALLALMFITALGPEESRLIAVLHMLVLGTGLYALSYRKSNLVIAAIVGGPFLLALGANELTEFAWLEVAARLSALAFYTLVTATLLEHVLRPGEVDRDRIFGAACIYLLLGIGWAVLFDAIEHTWPASFDDDLHFNDLMYFSFATLTTLGYGDITPKTELARIVAVVEAATGVLYTTILVARLVSLYHAPSEEE
jgi:hypothetical protein